MRRFGPRHVLIAIAVTATVGAAWWLLKRRANRQRLLAAARSAEEYEFAPLPRTTPPAVVPSQPAAPEPTTRAEVEPASPPIAAPAAVLDRPAAAAARTATSTSAHAPVPAARAETPVIVPPSEAGGTHAVDPVLLQLAAQPDPALATQGLTDPDDDDDAFAPRRRIPRRVLLLLVVAGLLLAAVLVAAGELRDRGADEDGDTSPASTSTSDADEDDGRAADRDETEPSNVGDEPVDPGAPAEVDELDDPIEGPTDVLEERGDEPAPEPVVAPRSVVVRQTKRSAVIIVPSRTRELAARSLVLRRTAAGTPVVARMQPVRRGKAKAGELAFARTFQISTRLRGPWFVTVAAEDGSINSSRLSFPCRAKRGCRLVLAAPRTAPTA